MRKHATRWLCSTLRDHVEPGRRPHDLTFLSFLNQDEAKPPCDCETVCSFGKVIRHYNPPLRFFIAAVVTYKVVCNTVIPEPIPSKSRLGSAGGAKVGFLQRIISIIGAYSDLGRDTLYVAVLRQLFVLSHRWR